MMDIEFYDERRDLSVDVLSLDLIRQLAYLVWRVPEARRTPEWLEDANPPL
jgi:hypothetical protein